MAILRNVEKSDTLEVQRQKINLIGNDLYSILSGSGDLDLNFLGLSDGTKNSPSLFFTSDNSLGIYKSNTSTFSVSSNSKPIVDLSDSSIVLKKSFDLKKSEIGDTILSDIGGDYSPGIYDNITLYGGSGINAEASIIVLDFIGDLKTGYNVNAYLDGVYSSIPLFGGSGSVSTINFEIFSQSLADNVEITNSGVGYLPGVYQNISLNGGSGSGFNADITIIGSVIIDGSITNPGSGYNSGIFNDLTVYNTPTNTFNTAVASREELLLVYGTKQEYSVVPNGTTSYSFSGYSTGENITINAQTGDRIILNIIAPGEPFWIGTSPTYDPNTTLDPAFGNVNQNGVDDGVIILDTLNLPTGTYYYYSSVSSSMTGSIVISDYTGSTYSVGDTITGENGASGVVTYADNSSFVKIVRFSTINGGTFSASEYLSNQLSVNAFAISSDQLSTVSVYTFDGSDFLPSLIKGNTYRFFTSDSSNNQVNPLISSTDFITTLQDTDLKIVGYGTYGSSGSFFDIVINNNVEISSIFLSPSDGSSTYIILDTGIENNFIINATANVSVNVSGSIDGFGFVNQGSGYTTGGQYQLFSPLLGNGSNFEYTISNIDYQGTVSSVSVNSFGSGYVEFDELSVDSADVGGVGSGFVLTVYNTKEVSGLTFVNRGSGYQKNDILTIPPSVKSVDTTLSDISTSITVSSTSGIYPDFIVEKVSGDGELGVGTTIVSEVVDSTTLIISQTPSVSGSVVLNFIPTYGDASGFEYEILGVGVVSSATITNPGNGYEIQDVLTVNREDLSLDPGPYTSLEDVEITVSSVITTSLINGNILDGSLSAVAFSCQNLNVIDATVSNVSFTNSIGDQITINNINSNNNLNLSSPFEINLEASKINFGTSANFIPLSGNFTTSGRIEASNLNINNSIFIENDISTPSGSDLILTPATGRNVKINSFSSLQIPNGDTSQRPSGGLALNGSIRYNTDTNQYEGYSESTSSWSSLGGVRDLDGNTYILAEQFAGSNDNTFYFYNDNQNTLKLTPFVLDFRTNKTISSSNISSPTFVDWNENTPVNLGDYIRYRNNIYIVSAAGITSDSTDPPIHSNGSQLNGTAELTWNNLAVDDLTFDGIKEVKIGPFKNTPLVVSEEIKILNNTVSTLNLDLKLSPFSGKKLIVESNTSIQIPAGTTEERGIPGQGSIRYSTTDNQFEGFNGTSWTSLGGVRDVDGNTFIIPETSPGSNENILYFYNDNNNTIQVSPTALTFKTISTIESDTNNLDINAATIGINSNTLALTTNSNETKFSTTSDNLEFAVSSGIYNDVVFRATNSGDLQLNTGFGTGIPSYTTLISNDLTSFELRDSNITSREVSLVKGTNDFGLITVFDPSVHKGAKIALVADNVNTNDREMIEFSVIAKGTDIFHTEYGNMNTGSALVEVTFDFDGSNNVRITPTLLSSVTNGNTVNVTAVITIIKK